MKQFIFCLIALSVICSSCKEMKKEPLVITDKTPAVLTDISVDNLPGAAKVTYSLPDDPGILYVEAVYHTGNGQERIAKSSVFKNFLVLEGFNSTKEQEVTLYVVNRSENRSKPIQVKIKPLKAPIYFIYESLKINKDFGGIGISFFNEAQKEYVLYTLMKDSLGDWEVYDRLYTGAKERQYSLHGLPSEPIDFGFFIVDKWHNHSDTLFKTITPIYEEKIDKSLWKLYPLDNDSYEDLYSSRPVTNIWDGEAKNSFFLDPQIPGLSLPNWLTIDLGQKAVLSRIRYYQYLPSNYDAWIYTRGLVQNFELWGSNDPSLDGSWDNWTLLATCESTKPSGLPVGEVSNEDKALALAGEDFSIPYTGIAYRYIRLKTLSTWGHRIGDTWGEISLWGQPQ